MGSSGTRRQPEVVNVPRSEPAEPECSPPPAKKQATSKSLLGDMLAKGTADQEFHRDLSLACEFNLTQKCRYPQVQAEACRSMPQHKKFFRGTALAWLGCHQQHGVSSKQFCTLCCVLLHAPSALTRMTFGKNTFSEGLLFGAFLKGPPCLCRIPLSMLPALLEWRCLIPPPPLAKSPPLQSPPPPRDTVTSMFF